MCGENPCNVFVLLVMGPWVSISVTLCKRAVLILWHAFLFLGLRFSKTKNITRKSSGGHQAKKRKEEKN
jgi:hypothetical protein